MNVTCSTFNHRIFTLIAILSLLSFDTHAENNDKDKPLNTLPFSRSIDAITLTGIDLTEITDKDISKLRLFSSKQGKITAIPFQIDQRDIDEQWVWDVSSGAELIHDDDDPEGKSIFDDNDVLVFIANDVGNNIEDTSIPGKPDTIYEISVHDPVDNSTGWVYLAHFPASPPPLSPQRYIHFDKTARTIKANDYEFVYSEKHLAVMETLKLNGQSILDRTKVRGQVDLDLFLFETTIEFNEEEIGGYDVGYINGPVRLVKRSINHLVIEGMDAPDVVCDHFFYPGYSELPIAITMQFPIKKVNLRITGDYFGGHFSRTYIDKLAKPITLSNQSFDIRQIDIPENAHWMALDGDYGSIVLSIKSPKPIVSHLLIKPWLTVDKSSQFPPESIRGVNPEAEVTKSKP